MGNNWKSTGKIDEIYRQILEFCLLRKYKLVTKKNDSKSVGEERIRKYLETNNILFEQEKWFPDYRDINPVPIDFYLLDHNILTEFDGEQHYKQGNFTHSKLSYTQLHDTIKNDYCKNNNIKLIRIPYWDINNIEMILDDKLLISHKDIV